MRSQLALDPVVPEGGPPIAGNKGPRDSEKPLLDTRQPEGVILDPVARAWYELHYPRSAKDG
jgi:hypothetical protein